MITITLAGVSVAVTQRLFFDAMKAAAEDTVGYWHETFLPVHFTEEGFSRYNYQLRKGQDEPSLIYSDNGRAVREGKYGRLINNPKYWWQKWRRMKTHDPLVFTGQSKAQALASIRVSAKLIGGGASVQGIGILDVPKYMYQYRKDQGAPDKVDELTRTTGDEDAAMADFYSNALGRPLAAVSAPQTSALIA